MKSDRTFKPPAALAELLCVDLQHDTEDIVRHSFISYKSHTGCRMEERELLFHNCPPAVPFPFHSAAFLYLISKDMVREMRN